MPRHKRVTTCLRTGGTVPDCGGCPHCTLCVCETCGAYEGGLTTDCPGSKVSFDRVQEVYETNLDYSDDRGWHQGEPTKRRSPRFEDTKLPPLPMEPIVDPRKSVAPSIDWAAVDRNAGLQHELALRAIAWVIADRVADDHSAALTRLEDEIAAQMPEDREPGEIARELLEKLEQEKIGFHLASQRAEKCDDAFRQAARKLVEALETSQLVAPDRREAAFQKLLQLGEAVVDKMTRKP